MPAPAASVRPDLPLTLRIRVKPGARRTSVGGTWAGPDGDALVVAVQAPAVDGKANAAVVAAVAAAFGVRSRDVTITAGERSRDKAVEIAGDTATLTAMAARLTDRP